MGGKNILLLLVGIILGGVVGLVAGFYLHARSDFVVLSKDTKFYDGADKLVATVAEGTILQRPFLTPEFHLHLLLSEIKTKKIKPRVYYYVDREVSRSHVD